MLRPTACCVCHGSDSRSIEVAAWFAVAIIARPRQLWRSGIAPAQLHCSTLCAIQTVTGTAGLLYHGTVKQCSKAPRRGHPRQSAVTTTGQRAMATARFACSSIGTRRFATAATTEESRGDRDRAHGIARPRHLHASSITRVLAVAFVTDPRRRAASAMSGLWRRAAARRRPPRRITSPRPTRRARWRRTTPGFPEALITPVFQELASSACSGSTRSSSRGCTRRRPTSCSTSSTASRRALPPRPRGSSASPPNPLRYLGAHAIDCRSSR